MKHETNEDILEELKNFILTAQLIYFHLLPFDDVWATLIARHKSDPWTLKLPLGVKHK